MDALMPIDDQALQMLRELAQQITTLQNSFTAQLRSLTETINHNAVTYEQRLTAVERDLAGHMALDDQKHKRADERLADHSGEIEVLATQMGKDLAGLGHRIDKSDAVVEQVKTFSAVWKAAVALALAGSGITAWWQFFRKW